MPNRPLAFVNARLVDPETSFDGPGALVVRDGVMAPSQREYFRFYGLDREKLALASPGVRVMHPGPMNRGVEIDSDVADDLTVSLIQDQVEMGVAARMAVLTSLAARLDNDR